MAVGKSLSNSKGEKKSKLVTGKSRGYNEVGTKGSEGKGLGRSKKVQTGGNMANGVSYVGESKVAKKGIGGKRSANSKVKGEGYKPVVEGHRGFTPVSSGQKRKRIYAAEPSDEERKNGNNAGRPSTKFSYKMEQNKLKDGLHKEKNTTEGKSQLTGRSQSNESELWDKKSSRAKIKAVHQAKDIEVEGSKKGMLKRSDKRKPETTRQLEQDKSKCAAGSVVKPLKKKVQSKKSTLDDSEATDDRPRKRKRIQIDPHDTSNKRLDDGISINNTVKVKKEDSKNSNVELSKNAQFRAIFPSPSILSFVEDNLLGRRREIDFRRAGYDIELSAPLDNIPFLSNSGRERIEEAAFRNKLTFFAAAKTSSSFPEPDLPEIAFAGRSNVGKSSLLNSLTRQWGVVRTSDKPGLTQTINFFKLGSKLCLVDLPGYGFAYAKEEVKEAWEELVKEYVSMRVGLKRVCLLVDTKWGMKPRDLELIDLMERFQTKYQIILTKTDLVFPIDVARRAMQIEESLKEKKSAVQPVMMVSSKTGAGIRTLRTVLSKIARFVKP